MRDEVFQAARDKELKPDEMLGRFQQIKEAAKHLTPEQQKELKRSSQEASMRKFYERARTYMSLPEDEKRVFLDDEIDRKEALAREFPDKRAQNGRGDWQNLTDEQRQQIRREKLDRTTPQQRALWDEYMRALKQRHKERGL